MIGWIIAVLALITFVLILCVVALCVKVRCYRACYNSIINNVRIITKYIGMCTTNHEAIDQTYCSEGFIQFFELKIALKTKDEEIERLKKIIEFRSAPGTVILNKVEKNKEIKL